jgi:DNA-directed RNA polymerase specialized sigma24 family protein
MKTNNVEATYGAEPASVDAALVEGLASADTGAVERLVREYGPALLALARSLTGCDQQAQDVLQETMIKALRSIGSLERPGALGAWLHRIAANVALQHLRTRTRRRERPIEKLLPTFGNDGHREDVRGTWAGAGRAARAGAGGDALRRPIGDRAVARDLPGDRYAP